MEAYYPQPAVERAMKVQEVILRAMSGKITWIQAAEIMRNTVMTDYMTADVNAPAREEFLSPWLKKYSNCIENDTLILTPNTSMKSLLKNTTSG